jgi:hypothetical protein
MEGENSVLKAVPLPPPDIIKKKKKKKDVLEMSAKCLRQSLLHGKVLSTKTLLPSFAFSSRET